MIFHPTRLKGVYLVEPECHIDNRGYFARISCEREFLACGVPGRWVQSSVAFNERRGTLRGMHYQDVPHQEVKLVRCSRGCVYDVVLDLRPESTTCNQWLSFELSAGNRRMILIPRGCAHGYQTLEDATEVEYSVSEFYVPELSRRARWNDPAYGIAWPIADPILSDADATAPLQNNPLWPQDDIPIAK